MPSQTKYKRGKHQIDLSKANGPTNATVVVVPLPKSTIGIVFGQRTAVYDQRYNTYVLDANDLVVEQAIWNAPSENSRFQITTFLPTSLKIPDLNVLSIGPFTEDRHIAVHLSHKGPNDDEYKESVPKDSSNDFTISGKNAISFTMINGEDGGDSDNHDTVVGIAVVYTTK